MQDKIESDWFKPSKHEVIHYIFLYFFYIFLYFHIFFVITNRDFYCMLLAHTFDGFIASKSAHSGPSMQIRSKLFNRVSPKEARPSVFTLFRTVPLLRWKLSSRIKVQL